MRFRALDGWRGVCALLVALHHMSVLGWIYHQSLMRHAWMFVDFFFVLSGFVIAYAYGDRLGTAADARSFVIRRFGRLWPLHVTMLAALIALELVHLAVQHIHPLPVDPQAFTGGRSVFAIVTNFFLLQDFGLHDTLTWNTPSWSISAEFFTYLVFAAVCLVAPARWVRIVLALLLSLLAATILLRVSPHGMRETFNWGFVRSIYGFYAGVIAQEIWRNGVTAKLGGSIAEIVTVIAVVVLVATRLPDPRIEFLSVPLFALTVLVFAAERGVISQLLLTKPGVLGVPCRRGALPPRVAGSEAGERVRDRCGRGQRSDHAWNARDGDCVLGPDIPHHRAAWATLGGPFGCPSSR